MKIRDEIVHILVKIKEEIAGQTELNLLESGLFDSFDIANLVADLEEHFQIEINAEDIVPENFSTVATIEALIKKYKNRRGGEEIGAEHSN